MGWDSWGQNLTMNHFQHIINILIHIFPRQGQGRTLHRSSSCLTCLASLDKPMPIKCGLVHCPESINALQEEPTVGRFTCPFGASGKKKKEKKTGNAGDITDTGSIPGSGRSPGGGQPTPVFLPEKSQGQRSLAGYSPWSCKE